MDAATDTLLALDAGVGKTGWALFAGWTLLDTGLIAPSGKVNKTAPARIARLLGALNELRARRRPDAVALCQPSGMRWAAPALTLLAEELTRWAAETGLPLSAYPAEQVRRVVAGRPRASRQALAFAVMSALRLVGVSKTDHEWGAIAVGAYHRCQTGGRPSLTRGG